MNGWEAERAEIANIAACLEIDAFCKIARAGFFERFCGAAARCALKHNCNDYVARSAAHLSHEMRLRLDFFFHHEC